YWSMTEFISEAERLGRLLAETAIRGSKNQAGWVALNRVPTIERYTIAPLDHGVWSGTCGIGLFFLALYRVTGEEQDKQESLAAFARTRRLFAYDSAANAAVARTMGLGGGMGLGSIVYALVRAGSWLQESELIADACRVAELIDPGLIAADRDF